MELVLFPIAAFLIFMCALAVRIFGTDVAYKAFFIGFAFLIVVKSRRAGLKRS